MTAMATLHVRNVPDELYETLRARAEASGDSISGMAVGILSEALFQRGGSRLGRPRRPQPQPSERFTTLARKALVTAQLEARGLGHDYIGTEHLLLGLFGEGRGGRALEELGLSPETVRERVVDTVGRGEAVVSGSMPFTPRAKKVLELGLREALSLGHDYVGTEHILLGLAVEGEGVAALILREAGADASALRGVVTRALAGGIQTSHHPFEPKHRVVELAGSAEDWARELNEAAATGWQLVSVVSEGGKSPRAVFRCAPPALV